MLSNNVLEKIYENGILLLGCGGKMGHHYMEKMIKLGIREEKIIGIDINPENLKKIKDKYPNASFFTDWEDFMKPACAIITVNSTAHLSVIKECCKRDIKNIFIEKPLIYYQRELNELNRLAEYYDDLNLFIAYLINFSGITKNLIDHARAGKLRIVQAFAKWGKNWPGEKRIMGGDAEEETPHPLGLLLALAEAINNGVDSVNDIVSSISMIPHVQEKYLAEAKELELGFPDKMNDSTLLGLTLTTKSGDVPVHMTTSFNFFQQIRQVEISFCPIDAQNNIPTEKALIEFDVNPLNQICEIMSPSPSSQNIIKECLLREFGKTTFDSLSGNRDRLRIIDAENNECIYSNEYSGDKIQANLDAALEALLGEQVDPRLMGYQSGKNVTEIILGIAG